MESVQRAKEAAHYRARAAELSRLAAAEPQGSFVQQQLTLIAKEFEEMAASLESGGPPFSRST